MKQLIYTVEENIPIAREVYKMTLLGDTSPITRPGQFVNLRLDGFYLRRPISVCDCEDGRLTIIYKVVGQGTKSLSLIAPGTAVDTLSGLGNGYSLEKRGESPLLVGGGVGVPPLYLLAKRLIEKGCRVSCVLGFNSAEDVFYEEEFSRLGAGVTVMTADGSYGSHGFVTDAIPGLSYSFFYSCGPEAMFRAMHGVMRTSGQYSFEERMGCGFGACMGCSCKTVTGFKRICREGPVMDSSDIIWDRG